MIEDQESSEWFDGDEPPRAEMSESRAGEEVEANWFRGQAFLPTPQGEPPNPEHDIELTWKQDNTYESIGMPVASSTGSPAESDDDTERAEETDTPAESTAADADPDSITADAEPPESTEASAGTTPAEAPASGAAADGAVPGTSESTDNGDSIEDHETTGTERTGDESPERDADPSETVTSDTADDEGTASDEREERPAESPGLSVDQADGDDQFTRSPAGPARAPEPQVENAKHEQTGRNDDAVSDNPGLLSKLKSFIRSKLRSTGT